MKDFQVTVNGSTYEVRVEEICTGAPVRPQPAAEAVIRAAAGAPAPAPSAAQSPVRTNAGDIAVNAPMPGKVTQVVVQNGQKVKRGDVLFILEAMKMQNEIGAPADGTVKSVHVGTGQSVKPGEVMAVVGS